MNILDTKSGMVLTAGVVVLGLAYVAKQQALKAADTTLEAIDPTDPDNIFNQGVQNVGRSVTGNPFWTLGGAIYDFIHGDD